MTAYLPSPFDLTGASSAFDVNGTMLGFNTNPGAQLAFPPQPLPPPGPIFYISSAPAVSTASNFTLSHTGIPLKRGPEELCLITNGNGPTPMEIEANESKKVRLENVAESPPSKVVHIRNVPSDSTEQEVALLGVPFGSMVSMVVSKKVNQALLEMNTLENAVNMVSYYSAHPPNIRGRTVITQFSKHSRLETKMGNAAVDAALQAANQLVANHAESDPRTVLRVIVENTMGHVVNYLVLYKICHRFGKILRTIVFTRNGQFQCLIEFESEVAAHAAKLHLNGQNIYTGCCNLRVDFSKLPKLEVRTDSDKCRDFVRCPLSDAERSALLALPLTSASNSTSGLPSPGGGNGGGGLPPCSLPPCTIADLSGHPHLTHLPPGFSFANPAAAATLTAANLLPISHHLSAAAAAAAAASSGTLTPTLTPTQLLAAGLNTVLLVSNLNEEKVNPDALFTLFGVYGDVIRVKVMFNKKDNALIQFTDPQQAQTALDNLNGMRVWERPLKIAFSRHAQVQLPKEGAHDAGLTKDYSVTNLHRFKKPHSKNYQNIFPPSATLHLSNIPATTSEADLKTLFDKKGYTLVSFRFMLKEKKMALAQLESVDAAILALIDLHNTQLSENFHLRVSFSKAVI